MTWTAQDYQLMSKAVQLAKKGRYTCAPNPCVGCVITKQGAVIASGWHAVTGEAHAEIHALKNCKDAAGSTVYLSLEPCAHQGRTPPCVDALIAAKVKEVVIAMLDPNPAVSGRSIEKLAAAGITTRSGLMAASAAALNPGFIKRMTAKRPYICCKLAMSIDGGTALANGESRWITTAASRHDVHRLRAACSAILTSADTVITDDPLLNVRHLDFECQQPIRVIIDRQLKTPPEAKLFTVPSGVIIYTESQDQARVSSLEKAGATVVPIAPSATWLVDVVTDLAVSHEINTLMIEAGPQLAGAFIDAQLVDELIIYMAPVLLGHDALPLVKLQQIEQLSEAKKFTIKEVRLIGNDVRFTLTPPAKE